MQKGQRQSLSHFLVMVVLLFTIWVLLSGIMELKFLLIGLGASIVISLICRPFLYVKNKKTDKEYFILSINPIKFFIYFLWLLKEIIKSTIEVSREILQVDPEHEPRIVYFSMPFENPMANVILSHSIILTPGTITIDISKDGIYEVHALNESLAEGLLGGEMQMKVAHLFNETCEFKPLEQHTYIRKGVK